MVDDTFVEVDRARCAMIDLKSQNTKEFLGTECASVIKPGYNNDFEGLQCLSSGLSLLSFSYLYCFPCALSVAPGKEN